MKLKPLMVMIGDVRKVMMMMIVEVRDDSNFIMTVVMVVGKV